MERKAMSNTEKPRAALFTVRDAEDALVRLISFLFLILGGILLHERILAGQTWLAAFYVMLEHGGDALAWATSINLFVEGGMIMFSRLQDHRDRRKRRFAEARAEGITEGIAKGKAEGRAEGITEGIAKGKAEGRAEGITEGRAEGKAEGRAEGITEGRAEGRAEGITEGRAKVYQEIAEWNNRRLDAEARNEPFTEPFPEPPDTTH